MTDYIWTELRDPFSERVGGHPSSELEQRVIDVFLVAPQLVEQAMQTIGDKYERGLVRSGWPVLAMEVEQARDAQGRTEHITASDSNQQAKLVRSAEAWMRTAGCHFDRASEVEDAMFGAHGPLRAWADDRELVDRMLALWLQERPRGELVESEEQERATLWRAGAALAKQRRRLAVALAEAQDDSPPPEPVELPEAGPGQAEALQEAHLEGLVEAEGPERLPLFTIDQFRRDL